MNFPTTKQEIFDAVVVHLRAQKVQSTVPNMDSFKGVSCRYRGDNGCKCAVGAFITDEEYHPNMEGIAVGGLTINSNVFGEAMKKFNHEEGFWRVMQDVHDCNDPKDWENAFKNTAYRFKLQYTAP